ncbi:MAG: O-antigen ligase family protein, partial [Solirubrobacteraceae bacterium]
MSARQARMSPLLLAPIGVGATIPLLTTGGGALPLFAALALLLVAAFTVWPWAVLPASIVGGTAATTATGLMSVSAIVALHGGVLAAGLIALSIRRLVAPLASRRRAAADIPMVVLTVLVALGCLYGIAAGNRSHAALVATYELGVIPAYYWLATLTLAEPSARRRAMLLFLIGAVLLAASGLTTPGRHGGLLSALALVPTLLAASRTRRSGARWILLGCTALLGVDVALSAYRSVWLATGIALFVVVIRGTRSARRHVLAASVLTAAVAITSLAVSSAAPARLALVESQLGASAGYRLPEAAIGLRAFNATPIFGAGMGQTTPAVYVPAFRVEDVGPVYHVFYVTVLANGGVLLALVLAAAMFPALAVLRT